MRSQQPLHILRLVLFLILSALTLGALYFFTSNSLSKQLGEKTSNPNLNLIEHRRAILPNISKITLYPEQKWLIGQELQTYLQTAKLISFSPSSGLGRVYRAIDWESDLAYMGEKIVFGFEASHDWGLRWGGINEVNLENFETATAINIPDGDKPYLSMFDELVASMQFIDNQ